MAYPVTPYPDYGSAVKSMLKKHGLGKANYFEDFVAYVAESIEGDPVEAAEQLLGLLAKYDKKILEEEVLWFKETST